jgi:hypothetical protein
MPQDRSRFVNETNRRFFMLMLIAGSSTLGTGVASAQAKVDAGDPQAMALGYTPDSAKVDAKKFPMHDTAQRCGTCQLFQGKPSDPTGPCPLFAGKVASSSGWCSAWVKKA